MQARINDTELFYTTHGQGHPVLVMHGGLGLDHTYFRPWLDNIGAQAQLVYYDHRGNGRSTRYASFEGINYQTWASDADALRAYLGYEKIILFGHSFGGFIAQEYALRHGDHLDGLILCCTAPAIDYADIIIANAKKRGTPDQFRAVINGLSSPIVDDARWRQFWIDILPLYFTEYDPKVGAAMDQRTHYCAGAFSHHFFKCAPAFNTLSQLASILVPTLVIAGRNDWVMPTAQGAERLHAGLPNSELVIFDNSGHFPFIEENDEFVAILYDWIRRLGPHQNSAHLLVNEC